MVSEKSIRLSPPLIPWSFGNFYQDSVIYSFESLRCSFQYLIRWELNQTLSRQRNRTQISPVYEERRSLQRIKQLLDYCNRPKIFPLEIKSSFIPSFIESCEVAARNDETMSVKYGKTLERPGGVEHGLAYS